LRKGIFFDMIFRVDMTLDPKLENAYCIQGVMNATKWRV
jgi:hypothetical protein